MSDFPSLLFQPAGGVISSLSPPATTGLEAAIDGASIAAAVWPAANRAIYMPFLVDYTVTITHIGFEVSVQSGNCDVGIYDENSSRVVSKGSTAVGAAGIQTIDITDTTLNPGLYFIAMCVDNITASIFRFNGLEALALQVLGVQQQAVGAVTLPDPATFANPAANYLPVVALTTRTVL
jgi:hypothetical protein